MLRLNATNRRSSATHLVLLIGLVMAGITISAQCDGRRYLDPIFSAERSVSNQTYATAPALAGLCNLEWFTFSDNLQLDVYTPVGDTLAQRPCIVYAHGGAFAIGDKRMAPVEDYCYAMARRGFVVVSIDYRKCFNALSFDSPVRAVYRAVQDMSSAIRYVKEFAPLYGIDTNLVFAGGNSAGGFMALHAAYAEEDERASELGATYNFPNLGCIDCSGNSYDHGTKPAAVLNFWGAIFDTAWIEPGDAPLLSIHGGADVLVYPGLWPPFSWPLFPAVYGSLPINERADRIGVPSDLWYLPLEGHEPWLLSINSGFYFDFVVEKSSTFLFDHLLKPAAISISGAATSCIGESQTYSVTTKEGSRYCWTVAGGTVVSTGLNTASVVWDTEGIGVLTVSETNRLGATGDAASLNVDVVNDCCPIPPGLNTTVTGQRSVDLSWFPVGSASGYELEGGQIGRPTKTLIQTGTNRSLGILAPGRNYHWRVRSLCGTASSPYSAFQDFSTPISRQELFPSSLDQLVMFPNPNSGAFTLTGLPTEPYSLVVYDLLGRTLREYATGETGASVEIDLTQLQLPSGQYLLRIKTATGERAILWQLQ